MTIDGRKKRDPWIQGYACACAVLAQIDGFGDNAREILLQGGFSREALVNAECELSDINRIFDEAESEEDNG